MGKTYTTGMQVRLAFQYNKQRFVPKGKLPKTVWLNVTAQGWPLAVAAYGPTRPIMIIRPGLKEGYWRLNAAELKRQLQRRLSRVRINAVADTLPAVLFDSIISRQLPVQVVLAGGEVGRGYICYKGPSGKLAEFPRLYKASRDSLRLDGLSLPLRSLVPQAYARYICRGERLLQLK